MKAIILAAGRGSRLKNLTDEKPKCLIEVRGKSLLNWQLEALNSADISDIAIVTGYKRELLANLGLHEFHNPRWSETNMVSSLACAKEWLENEACIVSYSDIFYSCTAVKSLMTTSASLAITYDPNWLELWSRRFVDPLLDAETFRLTPTKSLAEIGNKPNRVKEIEGQYMGLLRFNPSSWAEIVRIRDSLPRKSADSMHMTGTLQKVIEAGHISILAIPYEEDWGEIDSLGDLNTYDRE
jgi:hypothetical protein